MISRLTPDMQVMVREGTLTFDQAVGMGGLKEEERQRGTETKKEKDREREQAQDREREAQEAQEAGADLGLSEFRDESVWYGTRHGTLHSSVHHGTEDEAEQDEDEGEHGDTDEEGDDEGDDEELYCQACAAGHENRASADFCREHGCDLPVGASGRGRGRRALPLPREPPPSSPPSTSPAVEPPPAPENARVRGGLVTRAPRPHFGCPLPRASYCTSAASMPRAA